MGAWGGGLYESDFGCDLRADFNGFLRAPLSDDEFLAQLAEAHATGADDDHVEAFDYWLVLADLLERKGMHRPEIFGRAIGIIERGEDLVALEKLSAKPDTLAGRRKDTAALLGRLRNPRPAKARKPLRKPQPLLFEAGEALTWPTDKGNCFSEFLPGGTFEPDGWGFAIVTGADHEYGVFARYRMQILMWRRPERPNAEMAIHCRRSSHSYGGVSKRYLEFLRVERLGKVAPAAIWPLPTAENTYRQARWFGLDSFQSFAVNFLKFPHPAPSDTPIDPDEPDQRPGAEEYWAERDRLARLAKSAEEADGYSP